jgi:hypothetical protein
MTLKLAEEPEECEKCSWTVPADFRNMNDAKAAVVHVAFGQGAIEFLRFEGESPPEGHKVELPPPRKFKKAKRIVANGTENEGEPPKKMLSARGGSNSGRGRDLAIHRRGHGHPTKTTRMCYANWATVHQVIAAKDM